MNLKQAKIGQKYHLFVDKNGQVITKQTTQELLVGTVIGLSIDGTKVLFGWKKNESIPSNARPRSGLIPSTNYVYSNDQQDFSFSLSVSVDTLTHSGILPTGKSDGCQCKKCHNFYPYAEPNQEDGTLLCYSCRMSW